MCRLDGNRWIQAFPVWLVVIFAGSLCLAGQSPKSLVASDSATLHASPPITYEDSPEQTGDLLVLHQHYQAAITAYSQSLQRTATIWNKMGIAYQMMFNASEAMRCYKQSLKLEPRNPRLLNNMATVYASIKQFDKADHLYRKALKLQPDNASILKNLGTDLLTERKYDKGWIYYQQALAADPNIFGHSVNPKIDNPAPVKDRGAMNYYMALGCVRTGYSDCALEYLRAAVDEGFITRKRVAADGEFASLRSNPDFQRLITEPSQ
jgi:tetratricopeptide (TPR) repeat protein